MNTLLSTQLPNPFYLGNLGGIATSNPAYYSILSKSSYITAKTIAASNLVHPYPQMSTLRLYNSNGSSQFQEVQVNVSQRISHGLVANVSYQKNYQKDRDFYKNPFESTFPDVESSNLSAPWRITSTAVYTLPFGRGEKWAQGGWKNAIFGGFILSEAFEAQPGQLLTFGNLFYIGNTTQIPLRKAASYANYTTGAAYVQAFNIQSVTATYANSTCTYTSGQTGFVTNSSCQPNGYNLRVFPTHVENVRQQGVANWNSTLTRTFHPLERLALETRVDLSSGVTQIRP
jgi:hypothetical protein